MNLKKTLLSTLMILQLCLLIGYDYTEKASKIDDLIAQQELQKSEIETLEKQRELDKHKIEHLGKQQTIIINNIKTFAGVMRAAKDKQDEFVFTEFNPAQTQYFILNNSSIGLAGKILSIDTVENGSVIHISPVSSLSTLVSNMGLYVTWGGEKPTDINALAKRQQLLFSTSINSSLKLLPGQW